MTSETERVRRLQDRNAPSFDRQMAVFERLFVGEGRRWVCERAQGDVLEIAVGSGRNLPWYRDDVSITGVELSGELLAIARRRARELGRRADLRLGDVQALELPDESFDTVVCTFSLCTIPEPRRAVDEARRVLRPGGRLLLLEHVRSPFLLVRGLQRLLDPILVRVAADHLTREPLDEVTAAGFDLEEIERSRWGVIERLRARKPDTDAGVTSTVRAAHVLAAG